METEYAAALRDYLAGSGEEATLRAYELGRKAITDGVGLIELAAVHGKAVAAWIHRGKSDAGGPQSDLDP